jgi:peptide deformylase
MKLELAYIGHEILRKKTFPIHAIDQSILDLIASMKETVISFRGLGLAAPQVGVQLNLLITCFPEPAFSEDIIPGPARVFINPKISDPSVETLIAEEGCLSIPKIYHEVERPESITVTAQNEQGDWFTERLSGWNAKILMHENDHLNGVIFIDRIKALDKKRIHSEIERLKKHFRHHNEHLKLWKVSPQ